MCVYVGEGELICEHCAVDMTEDERAIGGETDSPAMCSCCHRPLFETFGLTSEGVAYVLQTVRKDLKRGTKSRPGTWPHGYYAGAPWIAPVRDWAAEVLGTYHRLPKRDRRTLELFLFFTREET